MANMRVVSRNAVKRATLAAASVGVLAVDNLKTNDKSKVFRANGLSVAIKGSFAAAETIACAHLTHCNLSPTGTFRVRATNEASATNLLTVMSGKMESFAGGAPTSVRYVLAPDGNMNAVVTTPALTTNRFEIQIPIGAYVNGTVLVVSWHQKTVPHVTAAGQVLTPQSWAGATMGAINSVAAANGYTRKWTTVTITDASAIQYLRWYTPTVGADDIAVWGWMLTLGPNLSSYYPTLSTFVSRASTGTYIGSTGLVETAAVNVARMQYQAASLTAIAPRLLIETASTNLATYSQEFDNAVWPKTGAGAATAPVVTANYALAPDNTMTADRLVCSRTGSTAGDYSVISRAFTGKVTGDPYSAAIWMKSNTGANQNLLVYGATSGAVQVVTPKWQRLMLVDRAASSAFNLIFGTRGGTGFYYTGGDAVLDISIWQGQVEANSAPTSDIPTGASTVTRSADVVTTAAGTRPVGYMDWWQSYNLDTGHVLACPAPARELEDWTPAQAASAYFNGGGAHAFAYFAPISCVAFMIDIVDTANLQGYVEAAAALVVGDYWEPTYSATAASMTPVDSTVLYRNAAGGQMADAGHIHRTMPIELGYMEAADRAKLANLLMTSRASPILVDLLPGSGDLALRRDSMIYGRRSRDSELTLKHAAAYGSSIEVEEI